MNILVVEDERTDFILIKYAIEQLTTPCSIHHAQTLQEAHIIMGNHDIGLAVVDILLPDGDGYKMAEHLKKRMIPYIMVSSRALPEDAILGLRSGAEDYIRKPFDVDELSARLERVLSRFLGALTPEPPQEQHPLFEILSEAGVLLTPTEEQLLELLTENQGAFIPTDALIHHIWGEMNRETSKGALRTYISHIRKKMESCSAPFAIASKWGRGYQLKESLAGEIS